ncbi:MAG: YifB family Mg chelatase-like AAA ATPase [Patescibacteria group bacterium]|nr:YifB family Mg chelatase-like AAA ATPase [Patescibacteria group bacterium]
MLSKVYSGAIVGLEGMIVEVEVDLAPGIQSLSLVGLGDKAIAESKERLAAAIKNSGLRPPQQLNRRIIMNLAPADLKKEGSLYDLALAIGYLAASEQLACARDLGRMFFIGELALDGTVRPVDGVLPLAIEAKNKGFGTVVVPQQNGSEASCIAGLEVVGVGTLRNAIDMIEGRSIPPTATLAEAIPPAPASGTDFSSIRGQENAKRTLEIAAAGGHHVLLTGTPGGGKTLLAEALPTILPPLNTEEAIEVTKIWSVAGLLPRGQGLRRERPFRAPHHTASGIALVGGGTSPRPGEITLAHRGVLFLDEFPEFQRDVLENLRQPLEQGAITISRAQGSITFPARFQLIAAMNPCPCGFAGDPQRRCTCPQHTVERYQKKISGPILDRIDIHLEVPAVDYEKLIESVPAETSAAVRARVLTARRIQEERFYGTGIPTNAEIRHTDIERFIPLDESGRRTMRALVQTHRLSARAFHRILKVARTIADLAGVASVGPEHLLQAAQLRPKTENS